MAMTMQSREDPDEAAGPSQAKRSCLVQPDIRNSMDDSADQAYLKLMRTAYEMALHPSMPHKHFEVLVKCQKANGARLIKGKDNHKTGRSAYRIYP